MWPSCYQKCNKRLDMLPIIDITIRNLTDIVHLTVFGCISHLDASLQRIFPKVIVPHKLTKDYASST